MSFWLGFEKAAGQLDQAASKMSLIARKGLAHDIHTGRNALRKAPGFTRHALKQEGKERVFVEFGRRGRPVTLIHNHDMLK